MTVSPYDLFTILSMFCWGVGLPKPLLVPLLVRLLDLPFGLACSADRLASIARIVNAVPPLANVNAAVPLMLIAAPDIKTETFMVSKRFV